MENVAVKITSHISGYIHGQIQILLSEEATCTCMLCKFAKFINIDPSTISEKFMKHGTTDCIVNLNSTNVRLARDID